MRLDDAQERDPTSVPYIDGILACSRDSPELDLGPIIVDRSFTRQLQLSPKPIRNRISYFLRDLSPEHLQYQNKRWSPTPLSTTLRWLIISNSSLRLLVAISSSGPSNISLDFTPGIFSVQMGHQQRLLLSRPSRSSLVLRAS